MLTLPSPFTRTAARALFCKSLASTHPARRTFSSRISSVAFSCSSSRTTTVSFRASLRATYSYTLTNAAASDGGTLVEFTSTTNGVSDDCLDDVPPPGTLEPDETLIIDKQILIDMTVRQTYDTTVFVRAETPGGASCEDTTTLSFEAGNPSLPTFGR